MPIVLRGDEFFGTLCGIDPEPRQFNVQQAELLTVLARLIATHLERDQAEAALRESEDRYRQLVELSPSAIAVLREDRIQYVNEAGVRLMAAGRREDLIGHRFDDFVPAEVGEQIRAQVRRARAVGTIARPTTTKLVRLDGTVADLEIGAAPIVHEGASAVQIIAHDITERVRAEELRRRLAAIVESSDDAIIGKSLTGEITSWNVGAERLYGYTAEEVIGRSIAILAPRWAEDEIPALLARIARGERISGYETVRVTKDGRLVDVSLAISPIRDGTDALIGAANIARDITQRKRAETELAAALAAQQAANAQLARLNKAKGDFVSIVSHEFRTPLTGIQGFSEMIRDEDLTIAEIKEFADDINRDAQRLSRMIGEMLDLDRMESGRMTLNLEAIDLSAIITSAMAQLRPTAPEHTFAFDPDPALPPLRGDRDKLTQVVTNVLSNAIKYSPRGGTIAIIVRRDGESVLASIRDEGLGIPPEALEVIFERYARIESGATRFIQGTGLGLPIARQIVGMHAGRLWAESTEGHGSTFHIALPLTGPGAAS